MKKYILLRILKAILAIFIVVAIVITMVFTMISRNNIYKNDPSFTKLRGNDKTMFVNNTLESLGYLEFETMDTMCSLESKNVEECKKENSSEQKRVLDIFREKGFEVSQLTGTGKLKGTWIATRDYNVFELVYRYFAKLFNFDHPNKIKDEKNPLLDKSRGYYFGTDHNGVPALMCNGCEYKYQIYFDGKFPFIHSNILKLNFGVSYPTYSGIPAMDVISTGQGNMVRTETKYPTGVVEVSSDNLHTAKYKHNLTHIDERKFADHYAATEQITDAPSMIGVSYLFGIIALVISYLIAIPWGVAMARNKGKLTDKIGILYINLLIAVPSLALIFFMKYLGTNLGFPDKFPQLGFGNLKSYIMPLLVMIIIGMPGIMTWIRRYMIDQSTADYVKFAKAKGLSKREISRSHIFKNAIIPIVNGIPTSIVLQIGGAIYTETLFAIPGMGKMLPDAINASNNNMIITLTFIFTALAVFAQLAGDILTTMVDPRISLDNKKGDI